MCNPSFPIDIQQFNSIINSYDSYIIIISFIYKFYFNNI